MACPESVLIGKDLEFSVAVHEVDTGELVDADSLPTYKVYKNSDYSLITSGTMTKIDATEDGFYAESLTCSTNDFNDGESYTLIIKAIVSTASGGITYGFTTYDEIIPAIGIPIIIQGFDALSGRNVQISGRYV